MSQPADASAAAAVAAPSNGLSVPHPTSAYCPIPDPSIKVDFTPISHPTGAGALPLGHFRGRHLLGIGGLTRVEIDRLMVVADFMAAVVGGPGSVDLASGCILGTLFYEPSTRTSSSFQAAMLRLGGRVMAIGDVANSSVAKGETLEDTVRCLQCYCNIIAMRHPETGSAARAGAVLDIPLINAGDGVGEHPTQALLDLYTMHGELGPVDGLTITMVGDLKNGRTVHSLSKLLLHFKCRLNFVSPDSLRMPSSVLELLKEHAIPFSQHSTLDEVMKDTDVLYGQINNAIHSAHILWADDRA